MRKKTLAFLSVLLLCLSLCSITVYAVPQARTPDYKVAFYPYDCYHMQDENGKKTGYGYEMMEGLAQYMQCTFSFVGYDKSAKECEEMLRTGELDIYTAARRTAEREAEFAFSTHPAITSTTCMNVKVGNTKYISGDYATYEGMRIGLLRRHTYNDSFLAYVAEKGFTAEIVYYETPTELSNALVDGEVDALVNSYIRIPEDEQTLEAFGETPYYIMARKEDQGLIDEIDRAFDAMSVETPNWRTELYNKYYGAIENNLELTQGEQAMLNRLVSSGEPIKAVMNPDAKPYSWYEDGQAKGIAADVFRAAAKELGLSYEILPVASREEYLQIVDAGQVDIWIDMDSCYEPRDSSRYKMTPAYLTTTMSILRTRGAMEKIERIAVDGDHITIREIIGSTWPKAEIIVADSLAECKKLVLTGQADGALLMSYSAQMLSREDVQNRLRVEIVPGASMELYMGVNAEDDWNFYGLWEKTLSKVSRQVSAEIVQEYLEMETNVTVAEYFYDHPTLLILACLFGCLFLFVLYLYWQSNRRKKEQEKVAKELSLALKQAEDATRAKDNFFSKMSHDIRTPLNVVLGMTQIAQKYKNDGPKLDNALSNIRQEGDYLLVMINSILDVNQLEHGAVELLEEAFNPAVCLRDCAEMLKPLSGKKEQTVTVACDREDAVVRGDVNRLKQILINIISNAIKYTGVSGRIDLKLESLPDNRFRFVCTDNGIGMEESFVQHICEDYTRAEDSRVSKTQGTGLGMSVVKGFTELMGGTLTIRSQLGKGSTFCVELPFKEASAQERETVLRPPVAEEEKPSYQGKKVLLVEDNALNAEIAMELLQTIGLSVDWAENGEIGIERFDASQVDEYFAVFMDMQMPVMDGVTATRVIRSSNREDHDVPIFAMTANTFASDRRSCKEAGMTGYIAKPVSVKDIEDALTELKE